MKKKRKEKKQRGSARKKQKKKKAWRGRVRDLRKDFRGPTVEDGWLGLFLVCSAQYDAALLWPGGWTAKPRSCCSPITDVKGVPRLHSSSGD